MPRSMTGYGRGEVIRYDRRLRVEIKAVNHRYNDVTIKLPRFLNPLEDRVRRRLADVIFRGKIDVWIGFESFAQKDAVVNVNMPLADAYIEVLAGLSSRYNFGSLQPTLALELLANNSDIVTLEKFDSSQWTEREQEEVWETLSEALESALCGFNQMREAEGAAMAEDIGQRLSQAETIVLQISELVPRVFKAQTDRLHERLSDIVKKLGQKVDDARLIMEMAILSDKGCISEELARLQSHFTQLTTTLQEDDAIGRKLDFLVQELNREANTISSKSVDVTLTALVVELKSLIEKMREQAQNIE